MGLLEPHVGHRSRNRKAGLSRTRKAITVHSLRQAHAAAAAAAETGMPILLLSAPSAAASAGPAWFSALAASAAASFADADIRPALDCGTMPGHALAALRHGLKTIRYDGPSFDAIAYIARQHGAQVLHDRPDALDLGAEPAPEDEDALRGACRRWLQSKG